MNNVLTEQLVAVAQAARAAGHGAKGAVYAAACARLGLSRAGLLRKLKGVTVMPSRKQRSDAGTTALTRAEAELISGVLMESARKNAKRLYSVADAMVALRANGLVFADWIDGSTGEIRQLSESTIHRALRQYRLHPDQLLAPAPVTALKSLHPNHVWQIDASLCTLYYLGNGSRSKGAALSGMAPEIYYKNKPANMAKISQNRVWSYEITDHASGWIYVEYVLGAESGENLCSVLINAMQARGNEDVLHGVPRILMLDPGSANTASMTKNLCRSLGIEMIVHAPGSARVTGQVENARNIIERKFEAGLKFKAVGGLDELNALARNWRVNFNSTAIHRRHGLSRSMAWMRILSAELITAPSVAVCRELAVAAPESRKVSPSLSVSFRGVNYDVSTVPQMMVGEALMITRNPWRDEAAQVVLIGEDGRETFHVIKAIAKDEHGFSEKAATIGETFKRHSDTPAQSALKAIEQLVTGTTSITEAEAARKAKTLPFNSRFDPYKHIDEATLPTYLPRTGTAHGLTAPVVELPPLSLVEAARRIKSAVGDCWTPDHFAWLSRLHPNGVPEDQLAALVADVRGRHVPLLKVVGGR